MKTKKYTTVALSKHGIKLNMKIFQVEYVTWSPPNEGPLTNVTQVFKIEKIILEFFLNVKYLLKAETDKYYEAYLNFAKFIEQHPDKVKN